MILDGHDRPRVGGPYFDDLVVGQVFDGAPSMTLTAGVAAVHQGILGVRMRLALDDGLARAVVGAQAALANPALVCDVAIGQSTVVTQRVKANLFYRGLRFHRFPVIGDSLSTRTEVVALRANTLKPGRAPTGMAALRMTTVDQSGRLVLDFYRCAMLPGSPGWQPSAELGDDLSAIGSDLQEAPNPFVQWDFDEFRTCVSAVDAVSAGSVWRSTGDVVSSAPELARLTLNIAATHHDSRVVGRRLVYGGHTIGLALAQATRLLPNLVVVLGWQSCDHTGPVHERDTVFSDLTIEAVEQIPGSEASLLTLRSVVYAASDGGEDRQVLDWRFTAVHC